MAIIIEINPEDKQWFASLPNKFQTGIEKGTKEAMLFVEGEAKSNFGGPGQLKIRTGTLRRAIRSESDGPTGRLFAKLVYAPIHELGGVIRAKNVPFLKFQIGENWKSVKEVIMPPRPYLMPAFEENMDEISEMLLDKILGELRND